MDQSRMLRALDHHVPATRGLCSPAGLLAALLVASTPSVAADIQYNRDIRPILAENCFACHGPDSAARKADLRLDKREVAIEMGAIVPGDVESSELVARVLADSELEIMPPPHSTKKLTDAQKQVLKSWVASGAEYEPHWSLIAPVRSDPPRVQNEAWIKNPIDRFTLSKIEERGLTPAPEADKRTLARRVSLDLTGLPPDPALVEQFVSDTSDDAYESLVDQLLAMPAWGEHRARGWLDAARYADTHGYHFDNFREMWSYRDWVIDAFNDNLPFDVFTTEQLAGDLLPDRTLEQQVASGFNRCNMTTNEGGTIPEEYLVLYTRDRTETVSQVFLGLTTGCAVCHDHKYDPITQREFYELAAFFNNTTQNAMDGNIKDTPPIVFVPPDADRGRWDALQSELAATRAQIEERRKAARAEFDSWLASATTDALARFVPQDALAFRARLDPRDDRAADSIDPTGPAVVSADSGNFEKDQPFSFGAWIRPTKKGLTGSAIARMDDREGFRGWDLWIENNRPGTHLINTWPSDALKVVTSTELLEGRWSHVFITYDGSGRAAGVKIYIDGAPQPTTATTDKLNSSIKTDVPLKVGQRHTKAVLRDALFSDVRVYTRSLDPGQVADLAGSSRALDLLALATDSRPAEDVDKAFDWWVDSQDGPSKELVARRSVLEGEEAAIKSRGTIAHVMNEREEPAMAYILFRGEYDKRRDSVNPDTPDALPAMPASAPRNRLGLAQWLLDEANPLTARVTVNRFWQEVFGTGLVRTSGDFGVSGELPSHPELLDWLALEFRDSGWDVKAFFKLIVTSAAYRQAAITTPEKLEKDRDNRLLSRGPRFRMEAEMIRDSVLATAGLLVPKVGGPSVKPYQPEGVWEAVAMPESNTKSYTPDEGDNRYRRSLYTFWKRAAPPALMEIFNAPNREVCTVRRERTNTPLQALATLNDPEFIEAARKLAAQALDKAGANDLERLDYMALRILARPWREDERSILTESLDSLRSFYQSHAGEAEALMTVGPMKVEPVPTISELAAWTMLANQVLNLDEALNK
jgi:mono/diheme cytochrome c family protein